MTGGFALTMQSLTGGRFVLGIGRGVALLQAAMGINRITTAEMEDFHPTVAGHRGAIDAGASVEELEQIVEVIPSEWLAPSATGTPEQCARAVQHQLDLGCDGVIMHGATPAELAPVVAAYRDRRAVNEIDPSRGSQRPTQV